MNEKNNILNREQLYELLFKLYLKNKIALNSIIRSSLLEERYINSQQLVEILRKFENNTVNEIGTMYLVLIVKKLIEEEIDIFKGEDITNIFTHEELTSVIETIEKNKKSVLPLVFSNVEELSDKREYLVTLSTSEILRLEQSGLIKIIEGMQRESEVTVFGDKIVSHVKFNKEASEQIADSIIKGNYYSTMLRWHLVENDLLFPDWEYNKKTRTLKISQGTIAEIDGQHRTAGIIMAMLANPKIDLRFPVVITVGDEQIAQNIINQDEKRQPIDIKQLKVFSDNPSNKILRQVKSRLENTLWKFFISDSQFKNKIGFVGESQFIEALEMFSTFKEMTLNDVNKWTVNFVDIMKKLERAIEEPLNSFMSIKGSPTKLRDKRVPYFFLSQEGTKSFVILLICLSLVREQNKDLFLEITDNEHLFEIITDCIQQHTNLKVYGHFIESTLKDINSAFKKYKIDVKFNYLLTKQEIAIAEEV